MLHRFLGTSGLKVSEISYGNWITHGGQIDDARAVDCVHAALDGGITTYDTADVYHEGRAETVLGNALAGQRRAGLEIFTKVYFPTGPGQNDRGLSRKHILESIDASLERLQTNYVDLYQAHRYDFQTPLEETMGAFADIVHSGKAHYIGVSEWTADQIRAGAALAVDLGIPFVSSQPQYSMLWRVIEKDVVPTCRELGMGQIVWSPLAQGVLTGKYLPGGAYPEDSRANDVTGGGADFISHWLRDEVLEAVQGLAPIADELGCTVAQLSIAWVLSNDNVSSAIVGASKPEQVASNIAAVDVALSDAQLASIDNIMGPVTSTDPALTQSPPERL